MSADKIAKEHRGSDTVVVFSEGALHLKRSLSEDAIRNALVTAYGPSVQINVIIHGLSSDAARLLASKAPVFTGPRTRQGLLQLLSKGN